MFIGQTSESRRQKIITDAHYEVLINECTHHIFAPAAPPYEKLDNHLSGRNRLLMNIISLYQHNYQNVLIILDREFCKYIRMCIINTKFGRLNYVQYFCSSCT